MLQRSAFDLIMSGSEIIVLGVSDNLDRLRLNNLTPSDGQLSPNRNLFRLVVATQSKVPIAPTKKRSEWADLPDAYILKEKKTPQHPYTIAELASRSRDVQIDLMLEPKKGESNFGYLGLDPKHESHIEKMNRRERFNRRHTFMNNMGRRRAEHLDLWRNTENL